MNYPFVKCLNPKRIRNPYTKETMVVSCGHCIACEQRKSDIRALKCNLECKSHVYCMFVTLTYSWDNIPLMNVHKSSNGVHYAVDSTPRLMRYKGQSGRKIADIDTTDEVLTSLLSKVNSPNGFSFPYLYKKDLQLFVKRFRKHTSKFSDEKIRYYGTGEYGPVHFRPHFHLLFWFSDCKIFWRFEEILRKSWQFGRVDFSLSRGSCAKYTASYLNSSCNLPKIYQTCETRPFSVHSAYLGEDVLRSPVKEIYKELEKVTFKDFEQDRNMEFDLVGRRFRNIIQRCVDINGINTNIILWRSLTSFYFPRCRGFSNIGSTERLFAYRTYEFAREWTQEISPYRQAKKIIEYIYENWTNGDLDWRVSHFVPEYDKLLKYLFENQRFSCKKFCRCDKDVFEQMFNSLVNDLYISRQFFTIRNELNIESFTLVHLIEKFYELQDYANLSSSYADQEELQKEFEYECEDINIDCFPYFMHNVNYDISEFTKSRPFLQYKSNVMQRAVKSVKHKELNDANLIFNNI